MKRPVSQIGLIHPTCTVVVALLLANGPGVRQADARPNDIAGEVSVWEWINPATTSNRLNSVAQINDRKAVVVGEFGTILRTSDGGNSWSTQWSGTSFDLNEVHFADSLAGTAVGDHGVILRTVNGGTDWYEQVSGTNLDLESVFFVDESNGVVGGRDGTMLHTSDGGSTWAEIGPAPLWSLTAISGVQLMDSGIIHASAWYDYPHPDGPYGGFVHRSADGGATWQNTTFSEAMLFDISFGSPSRGVAVGYRTYRTDDGGLTWLEPTENIVGTMIGVCMMDSLTGVIVGRNGRVYITADGGDTWAAQPSGVNLSLTAVDFSDSLTGTAVGIDGTIIRSTDGGRNWDSQNRSILSSHLGGVFLSDASTGTAVGDSGRVFRTIDGGYNWTIQNSGLATRLNNVFFLDSLTGTAVGDSGRIIQTIDGGDTWIERSSETIYNLNDVRFFDPMTAAAVGDYGIVLRSLDGGQTWARQRGPAPLHHINGVFFVDFLTGTTVGTDGQIRKTTNGGVDWVAQQSGTTVDLNDIWFTDPQTAIVVGNEGTVLRTTDGGRNWTTVGTGTTRGLLSVWFENSLEGWAVGRGGTVLQTWDGGLTWYRQWKTNSDFTGVSFAGNRTGILVGADGVIMKTTSEVVVPTVVQRVDVSPHSGSVVVSWDIESDDVISGFCLIRESVDPDHTLILPEGGLLDATARSYIDRSVEPGRDYVYSLVVVLADGTKVRSRDVRVTTPVAGFALKQNIPNPFNPTTRILYTVATSSRIRIDVYDVSGRRVRALVDATQPAGEKSVIWDGRNDQGEISASGVYFYRLRAGKFTETRKMVLLR